MSTSRIAENDDPNNLVQTEYGLMALRESLLTIPEIDRIARCNGQISFHGQMLITDMLSVNGLSALRANLIHSFLVPNNVSFEISQNIRHIIFYVKELTSITGDRIVPVKSYDDKPENMEPWQITTAQIINGNLVGEQSKDHLSRVNLFLLPLTKTFYIDKYFSPDNCDFFKIDCKVLELILSDDGHNLMKSGYLGESGLSIITVQKLQFLLSDQGKIVVTENKLSFDFINKVDYSILEILIVKRKNYEAVIELSENDLNVILRFKKNASPAILEIMLSSNGIAARTNRLLSFKQANYFLNPDYLELLVSPLGQALLAAKWMTFELAIALDDRLKKFFTLNGCILLIENSTALCASVQNRGFIDYVDLLLQQMSRVPFRKITPASNHQKLIKENFGCDYNYVEQENSFYSSISSTLSVRLNEDKSDKECIEFLNKKFDDIESYRQFHVDFFNNSYTLKQYMPHESALVKLKVLNRAFQLFFETISYKNTSDLNPVLNRNVCTLQKIALNLLKIHLQRSLLPREEVDALEVSLNEGIFSYAVKFPPQSTSMFFQPEPVINAESSTKLFTRAKEKLPLPQSLTSLGM
jgi:hypothetical protein